MSTVQELAASISATAADYRQDELGPFTPEHVIRSKEPFDGSDRLPLFVEMDYVLNKTFFSIGGNQRDQTRRESPAVFVGTAQGTRQRSDGLTSRPAQKPTANHGAIEWQSRQN